MVQICKKVFKVRVLAQDTLVLSTGLGHEESVVRGSGHNLKSLTRISITVSLVVQEWIRWKSDAVNESQQILRMLLRELIELVCLRTFDELYKCSHIIIIIVLLVRMD